MASAASDLKEKALKFLDNLIENFGDPHKQFLQFMMKLRYVDVSSVGEIFLEICKHIDDDNKRRLGALKKINLVEDNKRVVIALLPVLNTALSSIGLHIAQLSDEYARDIDYWILVSEMHFSTGLLNSGPLHKDEVGMFHHWLRFMFVKYQLPEEHDSTAEDITAANEDIGKTTGELNLTKALLYAKKKGWSLQRAQKLLAKLEEEKWIRVLKSGYTGSSKAKKRRKNTLMDTESVIRLHPCAVAELEQLLLEDLNVPACVLCKHPIVVAHLAYTCECESSYHASCMLRLIEFPTECYNEKCSAELEEEILEDFEFDTDHRRIMPKRKSSVMRVNTSRASTSSAKAASTSRQPFPSLRDY